VIHPVSYERGKWLYNHSRYNQHMLLHEQDTSVEDIVANFRQSPAGTILVSPSVKTGFDFPGDACRYQILIKVPFPDTRNIILKKREEIDKNYSPHVVCQTIEQATGRSTRSPEDWSEVFLVDGQFYWYIPKHREEFMHKWFLEAVSWVNVAPEPLNFGSLQLNKPKGDEAYGLR
jgi:Rad3-related DNA helicase